jgi:ubiquinone/menaquinone biosynthesis C-methylase UbiE
VKQERYKRDMDFVSKAVAYNRYLVDSVRPFLGDRVLDVGCGVGNTTSLLDRSFVVGMDVSDYYLREFRRRLPRIEVIRDDISRSLDLRRLKEFRFDTIFCSNVLEHIEDDRAALANMYEIVQKGASLVLVVPNYQFLFGSIDEEDLHFRRYDRKPLREKLLASGFTVEREFCINLLGIFWWYLNGRLLKGGTRGEAEARLINRVIPLVRLIDKLVLNSAGLSLIEVARK